MSVKRTKDPAGLLGDHVKIDLTDPQPGDKEALESIFRYATPQARVARLRRHPQLAGVAAELEQALAQSTDSVIAIVLGDIAAAETRALYLDAASAAIEKARRKMSQRKAVTDDQVRRAIRETQTRADAAAKLGISERQLRERAKKLGLKKNRKS